MANPGLTIVKRFTYRGADEDWSNSYHFDSDVPENASDWKDLCRAVAIQEQNVVPASCTFVKYLGYDDLDGHHGSVFTYDLIAHGDFYVGVYTPAGVQGPGDAAAWARWTTNETSSTGKPIYLRKYFHAVDLVDDGPEDALTEDYKSALLDYADAVRNTTNEGMTFNLAGPTYSLGETVPVGRSTWVTTRTLKRRGRRPS